MPPRKGAFDVDEFIELLAERLLAKMAGPLVYVQGAAHYTVKGLSAHLGVPVTTLRDWRNQNRGPAYIRSESDGDKATILYPVSEVEAWKERQLVRPGAA